MQQEEDEREHIIEGNILTKTIRGIWICVFNKSEDNNQAQQHFLSRGVDTQGSLTQTEESNYPVNETNERTIGP